MSIAVLSADLSLFEDLREIEDEAKEIVSEYRQKLESLNQKLKDIASKGISLSSSEGRVEESSETKIVATSKRQPSKDAGGKSKRATNGKSLKATILEILERNPREWKKIIPDLESNASGLRAKEILSIIEKEGEWTSATENMSQQISTTLSNLKSSNQIKNVGDRRYALVA